MPSFSDSIVLFILALLLFGPKRLPLLARELGKWVGEFRRASNEFKMQMEEELRLSEQADRQKQIAAIEAAAPLPATLEQPEHPHLPSTESSSTEAAEAAYTSYDPYDVEYDESIPEPAAKPITATAQPSPAPAAAPEPAAAITPLPIATSGDLNLMPPATGLPTPRSAPRTNGNPLGGLLDAIPEAHHPTQATEAPTPETAAHGH